VFEPGDTVCFERAAALRQNEVRAMEVKVETYLDEDGVEKLRRVRFDSREIEVTENIDQWYGVDYRYFKIKADDGNLYIIRHNEIRANWELTMYEHE